MERESRAAALRQPAPLRRGDRVALISPATIVKREYVEGAAQLLADCGYEPVVAPHACGEPQGSYASSLAARVDDFRRVWTDPTVKAVICARGGYGCVHLLAHLPQEVLDAGEKWLVGFSDVSALHAMLYSRGIVSLHGPMAKHLTLRGADDVCTAALIGMLRGDMNFRYATAGTPYDGYGTASGVLRGGNLAVLDGLAGTPYDLLHVAEGEDVVLFIEDIAEPIYKVERMLTRLLLDGSLRRVKGLVVGQFTEYSADRNFGSMEEMIRSRLDEWGLSGLPVAFDFPVGHVDSNVPLPEGVAVTLRVEAGGAELASGE